MRIEERCMIEVKTRGKLPATQNLAADIQKMMSAEAHRLRAMMVDMIDTQGQGRFLKLSPWTLAGRRFVGTAGSGLRRQGTKPLVSSGAMRRSIRVRAVPGGKAIGIARSAPGGVHKLALVHEFGAMSRPTVTRKMLKYIHGVLVKAMKGHGRTLVGLWRRGRIGRLGSAWGLRVGKRMTIAIPARPFLQPAYEAWMRQLPRAVFEFWKVRGF
jgi:hypothetical protein